jgi:glutamyl/glutaminyl-tRNA synthetase
VKWLGFEWDAELYASDYSGKLYDFGELLVTNGKPTSIPRATRRFASIAERSPQREPTAGIAIARSTKTSICCDA